MRISEIYSILDSIAPFSDAEPWDNSGLLIGSPDDEFSEICLSLDLSSELIGAAKAKTLFITHHPLIFKGLKKLDFTTYPSNLIKQIIKKDISVISMHTNYDKHILNEFVLNQILGYKEYEKDGFLLKFRPNLDFESFTQKIKSALNLSTIRVTKATEFIHTAVICTGSGADLIGSFKADCFLSGDFKYHTAFESLENSLSLIDIGHFESEQFFARSLQFYLQNLHIFAKITNPTNPFTYR